LLFTGSSNQTLFNTTGFYSQLQYLDLRLVSTQQAVQADKIKLAELVPRHISQLILPLNRALCAEFIRIIGVGLKFYD